MVVAPKVHALAATTRWQAPSIEANSSQNMAKSEFQDLVQPLDGNVERALLAAQGVHQMQLLVLCQCMFVP